MFFFNKFDIASELSMYVLIVDLHMIFTTAEHLNHKDYITYYLLYPNKLTFFNAFCVVS